MRRQRHAWCSYVEGLRTMPTTTSERPPAKDVDSLEDVTAAITSDSRSWAALARLCRGKDYISCGLWPAFLPMVIKKDTV